MKIINKILGKPLPTKSTKKEELSILTGVPALGLDLFSSIAYGPEAALAILGVAGLHYLPFIMLIIVAMLFFLYLSHQQTAATYPNGGGAYIVASENLGKKAGLWAAIALLLDYLLNVAVGISAGVGAIISVIPALHHSALWLCLIVLLMLTLVNLRGIRESGVIFIAPVIIFITIITIALIMGLVHYPAVSPPHIPAQETSITLWLLLGAFANGLTAMTGIEAVSNAVPLFKKPSVRNARWTLTFIVGAVIFFLLCIGYLCPGYQIVAMNELQPGYQTILSQLVAAIIGKGFFYYLAMVSIFIVLTYSAQTSFADFPRVCRLLAEDDFLPHFFADKGRRLVYTHGIVVLAIFSGILLIVFKGIMLRLIPLFAIGAFSAFVFSQLGMSIHWWRRKKQKHAILKLTVNSLGCFMTSIGLLMIVTAKFMEGGWIIIAVACLLALLLSQIKRHYRKISRQIKKSLELQVEKFELPSVVVPIHGWDCIAEKALRFAMLISKNVTAIYKSLLKTASVSSGMKFSQPALAAERA